MQNNFLFFSLFVGFFYFSAPTILKWFYVEKFKLPSPILDFCVFWIEFWLFSLFFLFYFVLLMVRELRIDNYHAQSQQQKSFTFFNSFFSVRFICLFWPDCVYVWKLVSIKYIYTADCLCTDNKFNYLI